MCHHAGTMAQRDVRKNNRYCVRRIIPQISMVFIQLSRYIQMAGTSGQQLVACSTLAECQNNPGRMRNEENLVVFLHAFAWRQNFAFAFQLFLVSSVQPRTEPKTMIQMYKTFKTLQQNVNNAENSENNRFSNEY